MRRLAGKVCLVTGGGSGIGLAAARALLAEGARVAIAGRDEAKLRRAVEAIPGEMTYCVADVAVSEQVERMVEQIRSRWGPVDILVNNAGSNVKKRSMRELSPEDWRLVVQTNLDGAFYCIRSVLPDMRKRREGLIINVNSIAALRPGPLAGAAYAASKAGLRALAIGLAAEEKDVRVSSIYPGEVDTPILETRPDPPTAEHRSRILRPEDVTSAILFVATLPASVSVPELVIQPA
jgi:NAD(P)-dependent dehydrogenase (short-subunit alcohol dehydrogenase family)